jgi:hypothetical protein
VSRPRPGRAASVLADPAAPATPPGSATALFAAGLLFAILAIAMLEQSARWLMTQATRDGFVRSQFQIDALRDGGGEDGFAYDGRIVSSGELIHSSETLIVPLERLRALDRAKKIPGAREPVWYLPKQAKWAGLDPTIRFRIQAPEVFETDASVWTIVNVVFACVAAWLIRTGVQRARRTSASRPDRAAGAA